MIQEMDYSIDNIFCITKSKIKPFIILAILRRSVQRVCGAHFHVIAPS